MISDAEWDKLVVTLQLDRAFRIEALKVVRAVYNLGHAEGYRDATRRCEREGHSGAVQAVQEIDRLVNGAPEHPMRCSWCERPIRQCATEPCAARRYVVSVGVSNGH